MNKTQKQYQVSMYLHSFSTSEDVEASSPALAGLAYFESRKNSDPKIEKVYVWEVNENIGVDEPRVIYI